MRSSRSTGCGEGVAAIRVISPAGSPLKFGMPAAPLLTTQPSRPEAVGMRRSAGRHVWVLAKRSTSAASNIVPSQGRWAGSSSAATSKRQPASDSASPCTTPTRQSATR